jgi:hypothetical protein
MTDVHLAAVERTAPPRITPKAMPQRQSEQQSTTHQPAAHQNGGQPQHQSRKVPAPRSGSRGLCRI